jgi:signal transduction histidine kinase
MTRLSLRLRLVIAGAAAVVVAIALASLGLALLFAAHVERRALAELSVQLDQVLSGIEREGAGALVLATVPADPRFDRVYGGIYWQIAGGSQVLRSRSLWDYDLPLPPDELLDGAQHVHDLPGPTGGTLLTVERSVTLPERLGREEIRAAVALNREDLAAAQRDFVRDLVPYSVLLAVALILAGWAQIALGLRPLSAVGDRVAAVRGGRIPRLGSDFPAEVRPLTAEVDALLDEREAEIARARSRAADLPHGLKTPLQALLGEAGRLRSAGRADAAAAIEDIAGAMRRHVDRELTRARMAVHGAGARTDAAEVAEAIVRVVRRTVEGARLDWRVDVPDDLVAAADPDDVTEALGALVENAARHAVAKVRIKGGCEAGRIVIRVTDDGPGIPPERVEALMARGARADMSGGGTGLGLSIARDIAETLGGELTLAHREPGLEARLTLPAAGTDRG